jgi:adenine-specific DNA-methyltransferase
VPLFVHERLSTKAIIETLKGHKRDKQEDFLAGLFADPRQDLADQVTKAYEYPDKWVNRLSYPLWPGHPLWALRARASACAA